MSQQRGSTPTPVIPGTWGAGGNTFTPVSAVNQLPVSTSPAAGSVQNVAVTNLTTLTTGQVTATTTSGATEFVPALAGRKDLVMKNASTTQGVFVGPTGVTAANGHYLAPGDALAFSGLDGAAALAYFVITAANTALCTYIGVS